MTGVPLAWLDTTVFNAIAPTKILMASVSAPSFLDMVPPYK